jgi:hypothetical protein
MLFLITDGSVDTELQPAMVVEVPGVHVDLTRSCRVHSDELTAIRKSFARQAGVSVDEVVVQAIGVPVDVA